MVIENINDLLWEWDTDLRVICHAHYDAAAETQKRYFRLGVPVIVLSTVVGTSVFATLNTDPHPWIRIVVGLVSITAAVLAALQTFLKHAERAEKHREAGAKYGAFLKEIEQVQALPVSDEDKFREWADSFRQRWNNFSEEAPTVPQKIWERHYERSKTNASKVDRHGNSV